MDATQIEAVHDWAADAGQVPEGIVPFTVQHTDAALNALDKVCVFAWDIGDWPGPQGEVEVLDSEALRERNIDARQIARLLKVSPGTARALAEGRMVPTTDQLKAIAGQDDGPDVDLLTHANGPEVVALTLPRFKNDVWNLAQARGLDEATTRSTVWQEAVTLAARKTVNESETEEAENRIEMALKRLNKRYA
ncbi:MAG: helix-turn-helix transcriptional regulator [Actinomyces succiniciruminis]|nr:helix-turn-helix transcriptional regulator [Actinomyces succiniciruminis]